MKTVLSRSDTFFRAEHNPLSSDVLVVDGYLLADGFASVPEWQVKA